MLTTPPVKYPRRLRQRLRTRPAPAAPPVALTLVAATYEAGAAVTLTFDRAISIAGFDGSFVTVRDEAEAMLYDATGGAELIGPAVVRLTLVPVEGDSSVGVTLTASPDTGIVAVDDGGTWGGVSDLQLPFP